MSKKLCELCHERKAEVPDRDRPGRLINRLCRQCHRDRLAADLRQIQARNNYKFRPLPTRP